MKTGGYMKFTQEFMKAVQKELKRAAVEIELEGGEGTFDIRGVGRLKRKGFRKIQYRHYGDPTEWVHV